MSIENYIKEKFLNEDNRLIISKSFKKNLPKGNFRIMQSHQHPDGEFEFTVSSDDGRKFVLKGEEKFDPNPDVNLGGTIGSMM